MAITHIVHTLMATYQMAAYQLYLIIITWISMFVSWFVLLHAVWKQQRTIQEMNQSIQVMNIDVQRRRGQS